MSIAVLTQVYDETRRLAIAGSTVAPGDFRLKKLIPPLEQAGQKAPVFAKVAQSVQALVDSTEKTASSALLDLTTLVNAILYTQGETGVPGELQPLETVDLGGEVTQASARVLKPLLEALSSTGSGRLELIRDAIERNAFRDLRLIKPALFAIDDPYAEIGDLIAEKVLPLYGKAILPELRAKIDVKEKTNGHLNRLRLLHALDPAGTRDVVDQALTEGSKEIRVVAIECLGTTDDDLTQLLDHVKSKAKDVRTAALRALAASRAATAPVLTALKNAINGSDLELLLGRLGAAPLPEIQEHVLQQANEQFDAALKAKDPKQQGPAISRLQHLALALQGRTDGSAEAFLLKCFEHAKQLAAIKSEPSGTDFNDLVAHLMAHRTTRLQQTLVAGHASLSGESLKSALFAARASLPPADFFQQFSPFLQSLRGKKVRKGSTDHDRSEALVEALTRNQPREYYYGYRYARYYGDPADGSKELPDLDPRWLDLAVDAKALDLACHLARPDHPGLNDLLTASLPERKKSHEYHRLLDTMVKVRHPGAAEAIIDALKAEAKSTYYYVGYWFGRLITELPKSAAPALEAALPSLPEKMIDQLMEYVTTLKNKPD